MSKPTVDVARAWLSHNPVFLDTETTGLGDQAEIVDIAIVAADGSTLLDTLVQPIKPIPAGATAVHGITNQMVATAPLFGALWPQIAQLIGGKTVVIYNADYDCRMIYQSMAANGRPFYWPDGRPPRYVCAMTLYAEHYGDWDDYHSNFRWHKLSTAARQCGIKLPPNLHRAKADAELCRSILIHMAATDFPSTMLEDDRGSAVQRTPGK